MRVDNRPLGFSEIHFSALVFRGCLFLLVRWAFLGLAFLSAPEYTPGRKYAPRFLGIVVPKMEKYLRMMR